MSRTVASLYWFFTFNNYEGEDIEILGSKFLEYCEWYIFQEEKGESGTPHLQGTIKLKIKGRPKELFKYDKIHWEKTKAVKEAIEYCSKEQSRNGTCFTNLILPREPRLIAEDKLYSWQRNIVELIKTIPDERTVHWYWEANGCSGKTALCRLLVGRYKALCISGKATDCKHGIVEYIKKNKVPPVIILLNIPRSSKDYVSYEAIESIKDGLFFSGKYESGSVLMDFPHVIIFANFAPERNKLSADRWDIVHIGEEPSPQICSDFV